MLRAAIIRVAVTAAAAITGVAAGAVAGERTDLSWPRRDQKTKGANFWVGETGPTGPVFSGPQQYPLICYTEQAGLGQPLVDNLEGEGIPVYAVDENGNKTGTVIGYSKDCSIATRVDYFYRSIAGAFRPLPDPGTRPIDLAQTTTSDGLTADYVVRLERGTINRFIYGIATLAPFPDKKDGHPDMSAWNRRLIYAFQGGVGIGHWQGNPSLGTMLYHDGLSRGYAVAYSTGNRTSTQYNLLLGEETAMMVKDHFVKMYGKPDYTVGVGGSGGAIQQYVYGQNHPGLLDAAIPQYSYSDMATQTIYVGDCELLEYYFDVTDAANPRWATWTNRTLIEGMAASATVRNPWRGNAPGSTECINGWRGLTPLAFNPKYVSAGYLPFLAQFPPEVVAAIKWTHWDDARNVYGVDDTGHGRNTWDNVGVQYGLEALVGGAITKQEFLDLNARIGGWKHPSQMVLENYPWKPDAPPSTFDPWDRLNINLSPDGGVTPAPRTTGDVEGMRRAYRAGHVFVGRIEIPILDVRHYLEPVLDMHHSQQSFATRQRMLDGQGHADNQVVWIGAPPHDPTPEALAVIDEWMANIKARPERGVVGNKPTHAQDKCFDASGGTIASGAHSWDGILNAEPPGPCTALFPPYSTSRIVAGGRIAGDVFKCQTIPLEDAIARGFYGSVVFTDEERARLAQTFPTGVCDYSLADVGRPGKHERPE